LRLQLIGIEGRADGFMLFRAGVQIVITANWHRREGRWFHAISRWGADCDYS